eukprot:1157951-Pelagomonas_calceolata.AAC.5
MYTKQKPAATGKDGWPREKQVEGPALPIAGSAFSKSKFTSYLSGKQLEVIKSNHSQGDNMFKTFIGGHLLMYSKLVVEESSSD